MRPSPIIPSSIRCSFLKVCSYSYNVHDLTRSSVFIHDGCYTLRDFVYLWPGPGPGQAKIVVLLHILHYFTMPLLHSKTGLCAVPSQLSSKADLSLTLVRLKTGDPRVNAIQIRRGVDKKATFW